MILGSDSGETPPAQEPPTAERGRISGRLGAGSWSGQFGGWVWGVSSPERSRGWGVPAADCICGLEGVHK